MSVNLTSQKTAIFGMSHGKTRACNPALFRAWWKTTQPYERKSPPMDDIAKIAAENTDRELWREVDGDYYANSIHVTKQGAIGINVGGTVFVMPIADWHNLALRAHIGESHD